MLDQDKNLVAYCGMYCGDCWLRKENISEPAAELLNKVKTREFRQLAKGLPEMIPMLNGLSHYNRFIEFLESACFVQCQGYCRSGGGIPNCEIRRCCKEKSKTGCWECDEYKVCSKLAWLEPAHPGASARNLDAIKTFGIENYLKGEKYW